MRIFSIQSILWVIVMMVSQAQAQTASDYKKIFTRASQVQEHTLAKSGRYSCEQDFAVSTVGEEGHGTRIQTFGKSKDEAYTDLLAVCVKRKCGSVGPMMSAEVELMKALPIESLRTYLRALGKSEDELDMIIKNLYSPGASSSLSQVKCEDVALEYRVHLANICYATPVTCR